MIILNSVFIKTEPIVNKKSYLCIYYIIIETIIT